MWVSELIHNIFNNFEGSWFVCALYLFTFLNIWDNIRYLGLNISFITYHVIILYSIEGFLTYNVVRSILHRFTGSESRVIVDQIMTTFMPNRNKRLRDGT